MRAFQLNLKCSKTSKNPPPQIHADLPSVVPGLQTVEKDRPLGGCGRHQQVEPETAETISDEERAQEAKA